MGGVRVDVLDRFEKGLAKFKDGGKVGCIDRNGKILPVGAADEKHNDGVTGAKEEHVSGEDLIPFNNNDKWGFKNKQGRIIVPAIYDKPTSFNDGLALVCKENKWGAIGPDGHWVSQGPNHSIRQQLFPARRGLPRGRVFPGSSSIQHKS